MKIAFTGAQGVGKTTLLDILEKCFKFKEPVDFVRNLTRNVAKSGHNINGDGDDNTQLLIMQAHKAVVDNPHSVVVDRCALDGLVYTTYLYRTGKVSEKVYNSCLELFSEYIKGYDYLFYIEPEFPITGDEYRSAKEDYQRTIANIFKEIITAYNVPVIQLTGTVGDRLATVLKYIGDIVC